MRAVPPEGEIRDQNMPNDRDNNDQCAATTFHHGL